MNAKRFSRVMRDMARVPSQAGRAIAADLNREIQRGFDLGRDPYGKPWKKLAASTLERGRHAPPLTDTRAGRNSVRVTPTSGAGLKLTIGLLRMIFHQFGGASHLRGPGRTARQRYVGRKKHKDFGRDADRSTGRNNPPQRMFAPFDRLPRSWGEIVLSHYERLAARALSRG